jgi:hypothetical protein
VPFGLRVRVLLSISGFRKRRTENGEKTWTNRDGKECGDTRVAVIESTL